LGRAALMRTRHSHVLTAVLLLIAAASRGEKTMFALYRILLRMAVAWLVIARIGVAILSVALQFGAKDWGGGAFVVFAPAFLVGVLAWIIRPVQWTQD
jgi:hypothetical protein